MNYKTMKTDDLALELSELNKHKKRYLFRNLTESESIVLKGINREIKKAKRELATRQMRLKGF